jgi:RND family efflux transporter MFP subunit
MKSFERGHAMQGDNLDKLTIVRTDKEKVRRRRFRTAYLWIVITAVLAVILVSWIFLSKGIEVKVAGVSKVYPAQLLSRLNASGYVVAQRKADVASKITGQLVALMVQEGSLVKEGQVIARLENADAVALADQARAELNLARAKVEQAKADLENASVDYNRKKSLVHSGVISRSEFDAAQARYLGAKAAFEAAKAEVASSDAALKNALVTLSYSEIRAPFDAVVLTKNADVGDIITPLGAAANAKAAVVTIADLSSLEVEADVSEANLSQVKAGQPCDVSLDALPGVRFKGVVDTIVPTVDRSKATVLVKIRFLSRDPRILPEMSAKVGFLDKPLALDDEGPRIMVSGSAVVRSGTGAAVFVVKDERARRTSVRTGRTIGDMVEVLEGLKPGDVVVVNPPKGLRNGSKVTIGQQ